MKSPAEKLDLWLLASAIALIKRKLPRWEHLEKSLLKNLFIRTENIYPELGYVDEEGKYYSQIENYDLDLSIITNLIFASL